MDADIADRLDVLASRVRRFAGGGSIALDKIAQDIADLAREIDPRRRPHGLKVAVSDKRATRTRTTTQVIRGKRVVVQTRKPFAVFIG